MTMTVKPSQRPAISGLKRQFLLLIVAIYLVTGAAALGVFMLVMGNITRQLGEDFATQYALRQRDRLLAPIQRELALALKLTDSPLLKRWAQDEDNPDLRAAALAELDSYRRHFADHSYFMALDASKNYYFNDAANAYQGREHRHTLDPDSPTDSWYFATMAQAADCCTWNGPNAVRVAGFNVAVAGAGENADLNRFGISHPRDSDLGRLGFLRLRSTWVSGYERRLNSY